ncbi:MAG: hypothetical protein GWO23_24300 [Gammaproteobacteria bacterium]|nr:hypothetical protein [Gammaproteobacteria bacterium]NIQ75413.1 hypothetical protein [Gammaproteobacteria bacterium]
MKAYRHGEMVLIPVPKKLEEQWQDLYEQVAQKMNNPRVIAEGEITGHKHELAGGRVDAMTLDDDNATARSTNTTGYVSRRSFLRSLGIGTVAGPVILLKVTKAATLRHPEHNALGIPAGNYVTYAQREYDETMARRVVD